MQRILIFILLFTLIPKISLCLGADGHTSLNYNFQEDCCSTPETTNTPRASISTCSDNEDCIDLLLSIESAPQNTKYAFYFVKIALVPFFDFNPQRAFSPSPQKTETSTFTQKKVVLLL